jgi:large conductance mechanosensitive channel
MAVGIIIGVAFCKIVSSFFGDVIMPPIGVLMGGVDSSNLAYVVKDAVGEAPAGVIGYGKFIQSIIDFLIISIAVFMAVKMINSMKKQEEEAPAASPEPSKEETLLTEIRDALKGRQ